MLPGVYLATKKDGTVYYRSSITYRSKHLSYPSLTPLTRSLFCPCNDPIFFSDSFYLQSAACSLTFSPSFIPGFQD